MIEKSLRKICGIALPTQKANILKFSEYMKSDKTPCIIYADHESLIKKIDKCKSTPEKSSITLEEEYVTLLIDMQKLMIHQKLRNHHV